MSAGIMFEQHHQPAAGGVRHAFEPRDAPAVCHFGREVFMDFAIAGVVVAQRDGQQPLGRGGRRGARGRVGARLAGGRERAGGLGRGGRVGDPGR